MSSYRLHQQFIRLWQCCHGQSQQITLDELAQLSGCSRRHMRSLLNGMQQQGWLSWQAAAGRGKRSWLNFHYNGISAQPQQLADLLAQDRIDQLRQQLDADQLMKVLQAHRGYQRLHDQLVLRLLTHWPLRNLLPASGLNPVERHVAHQVFSGLLQRSPLTGEPQAAIAHHWRALSAVHWRFFLRPAVCFQHGRELDVQDVVSSLQRLSALPQGAHMQTVQAVDARTLDIHLQQPDRWLPWLLCEECALILPKEWATMAEFSRYPIGCGAYQVTGNHPSSLTLQAFNGYFGYRSLIDRVSIWQLAAATETDQLHHCQPASAGGQTVCYYLLFDRRSAMGRDAASRAWLRQVLSPVALLYHLPVAEQRAWQVAWSLAPAAIADDAPPPTVNRPSGLQRLQLTFCRENADFRLISQSIAAILARYQIVLECQPVPFGCVYQGDAASDIWLHEVTLPPPLAFSLFAGLRQMPLLAKCLARDLQTDSRRWQAGELDAADWCAQRQQQGDWLALFHHQPAPSDWCDFKSASPPMLSG